MVTNPIVSLMFLLLFGFLGLLLMFLYIIRSLSKHITLLLAWRTESREMLGELERLLLRLQDPARSAKDRPGETVSSGIPGVLSEDLRVLFDLSDVETGQPEQRPSSAATDLSAADAAKPMSPDFSEKDLEGTPIPQIFGTAFDPAAFDQGGEQRIYPPARPGPGVEAAVFLESGERSPSFPDLDLSLAPLGSPQGKNTEKNAGPQGLDLKLDP